MPVYAYISQFMHPTLRTKTVDRRTTMVFVRNIMSYEYNVCKNILDIRRCNQFNIASIACTRLLFKPAAFITNRNELFIVSFSEDEKSCLDVWLATNTSHCLRPIK